jgi:hypothetical protein
MPEATLAGAPPHSRVISVGYLALTPDARPAEAGFEARWQNWYRYFPWEDHRNGRPALIDNQIAPRLFTWAAGKEIAAGAREDRLRPRWRPLGGRTRAGPL